MLSGDIFLHGDKWLPASFFGASADLNFKTRPLSRSETGVDKQSERTPFSPISLLLKLSMKKNRSPQTARIRREGGSGVKKSLCLPFPLWLLTNRAWGQIKSFSSISIIHPV